MSETENSEPLPDWDEHLSRTALKLLESLNFPLSLPEDFGVFSVIETHISVVVLGEKKVLKFKKAVDFGFVNHNHVEKRWESAAKEVLLNRRLSKGIYLGLIPFLRKANGKLDTLPITSEFEVENPPETLEEVAVVMKRLPDDSMLCDMLDREVVSVRDQITPLAEYIADFHVNEIKSSKVQKAPVEDPVSSFAEQCEDNFREIGNRGENFLAQPSLWALELLHSTSSNLLQIYSAELSRRLEEGYFLDGHGDLRTEHVSYFENKISIIDCVEFNDSLRYSDALSDLAFLRMDLDFRKRCDLSKKLTEAYENRSPMEFHAGLYDFYSAYRALVRAKVELIPTSESSTVNRSLGLKRFENYLGLAGRYLYKLPSPCLLAVCGPMGVGKSTIAEFISSAIYADVYQSDILRKKLFGSEARRSQTRLWLRKVRCMLKCSNLQSTYKGRFKRTKL